MHELSIIVPVYRGEDFLRQLIAGIAEVRDRLRDANVILISECICVDDNSVDGSSQLLELLQSEYPWLKVLTLSRNFGQHPATIAGILHSSSEWVVTLDEDLQHDPQLIPVFLLACCAEGYDIIYAKPDTGVHNSSYRNHASRLTKQLIARLSGNPSITMFNSFRLIRGTIARAAAASCTQDTYLDISLTWYTTRISSLPIPLNDTRHQESVASNYTFSTLTNHATRLLLTAEPNILQLGLKLGFAGTAASCAMAFILLFLKLQAPHAITVQGWTSTMIAMLFIGSALSAQLGIAIKLIGLIRQRTQGKPAFFTIDRSQDKPLHDHLNDFLTTAPPQQTLAHATAHT